MSSEDTDWYPLPVVNTQRFDTPAVPSSYRDISIRTVDSTPLTHTELDSLWKQFLDMYIAKPHSLITPRLTPISSKECTCTCHHYRGNEPVLVNKPLQFTVSASSLKLPIQKTPQEMVQQNGGITLQQACRTLKKDFVRNSLNRQEAIKQKRRNKLPMTTPTINKPHCTSHNVVPAGK